MSIENLHTLIDQAWLHVEANQLAEAHLLFEKVCDLDPTNAEAWMMLGSLHAETFEYNEATDCLNKALKLDPTYPDAHCNLAKVLVAQSMIEEALKHCQIALENDPTYEDALQLCGVVQAMLSHYQESEDKLRGAISLNPGSATYHANLALSLWKQGKLQDAVLSYRTSLDLAPAQPEIMLQLSAVYTHLGQLLEAEECYKIIIETSPETIEAYARLGDILVKLGKKEDAIAIFRQASSISPDNIGIRLQLGWTLHTMKHLESSFSTFREVLNLAPDNAEAHFGIGANYGEQGAKQEEIDYFQRALQLEPDNEQYQYHVARLTGNSAPTAPPLHYIRNLFDAYADSFDSHLVGQLSYKAPELIQRAVLTHLTTALEKIDILDLGCGTGLCAHSLRPLARTLTGVDLSPRMIEAARKLSLYDHLIVDDIANALEGVLEAYGLIVAADVFVYVGELSRVLALSSAALRQTGVMAFTVEAAPDESAGFVLESSGRYSHSRQYLTSLALTSGFEVLSVQNAILRMDHDRPINGYVVVLRK